MTGSPRSTPSRRAATRSCLVASLLLAAAAARAEGPWEAVVVRSPGDEGRGPVADELLARVTGELAAAGFKVSVRLLADAAGVEAPEVALGPEQVAAVLLTEPLHGAGEPLRCLVVDTLRGAPALTEIHVGPGPDGAHRLALQVADLLRGKIAERALHAEPAPAPPAAEEPAPAPERAPSPRPDPAWAAHLELGPLALFRPGDWDSSFAPALALGARTAGAHTTLGARLSLAGYGGDVRRQGDDGSLVARQGLGLFELVLAPRRSGLASVELSGGLGAYGLGVHGASDDAARAHARVVLLAVATGGLGVALAVSERVAFVVRGQLAYAPRKVSLRIDDAEVARSGGLLVGASALVRVALR